MKIGRFVRKVNETQSALDSAFIQTMYKMLKQALPLLFP